MAKLLTSGSTAQHDEVNTNVYFGAYKSFALIDTNEHSKCEYCGKMSKLTEYNCEFCGAPLKEK